MNPRVAHRKGVVAKKIFFYISRIRWRLSENNPVYL